MFLLHSLSTTSCGILICSSFIKYVIRIMRKKDSLLYLHLFSSISVFLPFFPSSSETTSVIISLLFIVSFSYFLMIEFPGTNYSSFHSSDTVFILKDIFIRCEICGYFCSALEKWCATISWPLWFQMRNPLSFELVFQISNASFLSAALKNFSLSLVFRS